MENVAPAINKNRKKIATYISNTILFIWGVVFLTYPLVLIPAFTDPFIFAKEVIIAAAALLTLLLWAVKIVLVEKINIRRSAFDLPLLLVVLSFVLSAVFAVERFDALSNVAPVIFAIIGFFVIVNSIRKESNVLFLLGSVVLSAVILALWAVFSYFKVYPLPIPETHIQSFSPVGTLLEQLVIFAMILPISLNLGLPILKGKTDTKTVTFAVASVLILAGSAVSLLQLLTTQKPVLLPFETGFQTAFAAISQDSGRVAQGFLFGSGFGNFASVFTRFKQASFNANPTIWAMTFGHSSSFVLEVLATTGILGFLSYLFLAFRAIIQPKKKLSNPVFLSLVVSVVLAFVLPFSILEVMLFFLLLSVYVTTDALKHPSRYFDVELRFVALKKGLLSFSETTTTAYEDNKVMAWSIAAVFLLITGVLGYYASMYTLSDYYFQKSIDEASSRNGTATYKDQITAITIYPYRSVYYRIFSQTNMALANALSVSFPKNAKPSDQQQATLYQLIQQSINTGKQATTLSPLTVANWQNLSSIYRALIGFGQNSENFAVLAAQQSETLDPTNPQEYVALGGIYYQLGQYDNAIRQFQLAATMKSDFANAYYNLAHAYEQKGDLQNALVAYQAVQSLVANDKANSEKVAADIKAVQDKIGSAAPTQGKQATTNKPAPTAQQQELNLPSQSTQLPAQPTQIPLEQSATPTPAK